MKGKENKENKETENNQILEDVQIEENGEEHKNKNYIWKIVIGTIIVYGVLMIAYFMTNMKKEQIKIDKVKEMFQSIETEEVSLTEHIVYGTHLNLRGTLNTETENLQNITLLFKTIEDDDEEKEINLKYNKKSNEIEFYTSDLINEGIDLETINPNIYYMFIKAKYSDETEKYYPIANTTKYENVEYYTITKEHKNNKINIGFQKYELEKTNIDYMYINVAEEKLPLDVYDIVIDPGHGGGDVGAQGNGYNEADLTLRFSKKIKTELEKLGLKVRITRDGTEGKEYNVYTVYDENGRVNVTGKSKAKYVFSIHLNSLDVPNAQSGVEIYAPSRTNLGFAKSLATNIVKYGNSRYSNLSVPYKADEGVYVRTFTKQTIEESEKDAIRKGYAPYNITEDTPYLYMIRETGGIATKAYVDGRNKEYGRNLYYDSNIGLEAYLLELGYINNTQEVQNMLENEDGYVKGIVEAIRGNLLL